jgi:hypothetical protein
MEKIERDIRLAYLKQERSLKAIEKGKRDLMASAKAVMRGHAAKARLERKSADDLVRQAAPMGMVNDGEVVVETTPLPASASPVEATTGELARRTDSRPTPKPKRQRKPKVTEVTPIPNSEIFGDPGIDREKRMVSMGFRKTKKRSVAGEVAKILGETLS